MVRDGFAIRRPRGVRPVPLDEVESARSIARRFVASAMSVGALSPEAHQAVTIGMQRAGGAANTGEGGEDPAWYRPAHDGERRDARIKQVASARFGVTATYLARADQLEIKIAQGSKPGEGGQLRRRRRRPRSRRSGAPSRARPSSARRRITTSTRSRTSPSSSPISGRSTRPPGSGSSSSPAGASGRSPPGSSRPGPTTSTCRGHAGGTGASPLSSIKHAGAPWELGLAEVHQTLLRNGLRDRVVLRTDGGLRAGRDLLVAALLGAEEFGFGTAVLVALGCDMARQCHLDTCPTGIATQRPDLRAKFSGTPEQVERFALAVAEDLRIELATIGARSVGEIVGGAGRYLVAADDSRPTWRASSGRRRGPRTPNAAPNHAARPRRSVAPPPRQSNTTSSTGCAAPAPAAQGRSPSPEPRLTLGTADRSFGAELSGALERGEIARPDPGSPLRLDLAGAAGQSFGAFLVAGIELDLVGQANDYVAKGLSGGLVVVRPEPAVLADPAASTLVGNVCLFGATAGRLHVVGRAGMRFGVRNSGAEAVVEGLGAHGCEYMTGGIVVVLGPVGANFGAGMTGGRAYLLDPSGRSAPALAGTSVAASRLSAVLRDREDGAERAAELVRLVAAHAAAGSELAERLALGGGPRPEDVWLVEPIAPPIAVMQGMDVSTAARRRAGCRRHTGGGVRRDAGGSSGRVGRGPYTLLRPATRIVADPSAGGVDAVPPEPGCPRRAARDRDGRCPRSARA